MQTEAINYYDHNHHWTYRGREPLGNQLDLGTLVFELCVQFSKGTI